VPGRLAVVGRRVLGVLVLARLVRLGRLVVALVGLLFRITGLRWLAHIERLASASPPSTGRAASGRSSCDGPSLRPSGSACSAVEPTGLASSGAAMERG